MVLLSNKASPAKEGKEESVCSIYAASAGAQRGSGRQADPANPFFSGGSQRAGIFHFVSNPSPHQCFWKRSQMEDPLLSFSFLLSGPNKQENTHLGEIQKHENALISCLAIQTGWFVLWQLDPALNKISHTSFLYWIKSKHLNMEGQGLGELVFIQLTSLIAWGSQAVF